MKRQIVLALILAIAILTTAMLTGCKNGNKNEFTPPETDAPFYGYTELTLTKDPVIDAEGRIVLYFEENVYYSNTTESYIGLLSQYSAQSIEATPVVDAYADMRTDNGFVGLVLQPKAEIPAGAYTFSVTVGNRYKVEFNYIVE